MQHAVANHGCCADLQQLLHLLQDINMSLYFVTVSQKSRDRRSLGQRVPRYQKLVQVRGICIAWITCCLAVADAVR